MTVHKRILWASGLLFAVVCIGTAGFWILGEGAQSVMECFYMTMITISTIGFREVIDISRSSVGMGFTVMVAVSGIGILAYLMSNITVLLVEGDLGKTFARKKMEKTIAELKDHYIICGIGWPGMHIVRELTETRRPYVVVDTDESRIERIAENFPDILHVHGDATEDSILLRAKIERARGIFACTSNDNTNLVIALTAKQLNPSVRVVTQCHDLKNADKMKSVGANAVVCPTHIGGLRMASEMIRPAVVSFLDMMLRDKDKNLRVEEATVPGDMVGRPVLDLELKARQDILMLAVRVGDEWVYNPPEDFILPPGAKLVFLSTPEGRLAMRNLMNDH